MDNVYIVVIIQAKIKNEKKKKKIKNKKISIVKFGESGFRSRCLVVANDALYQLS